MIGFGFGKLRPGEKLTAGFFIALTFFIGTFGYSQSGCDTAEPEDSLKIRLQVGTVIELPEAQWLSTVAGGDCLVSTDMKLEVVESNFEGPLTLTVLVPDKAWLAGADCPHGSKVFSTQMDMFTHQVVDTN